MPDKSFFDRCASMSFGKLRNYIDSCLSALASSRPDANIPILGNDDFLKLLELLRAKVDEPPVLRDDEQKTYLQPPVAPPQFPAFVPSEQLGGLLRELNQLQSQLSKKRADRNATKRSIKKLEHKIQDLQDDVEPLKSRELKTYKARQRAYYKEYRAQLLKWQCTTCSQEPTELQRLHDNQALQEHSRGDRLRFCKRIRKDIERIFTLEPVNKLFWRILPPGEWTVDSVLSHYAKLQRANPHIHFDLERLERIFSLSPSSLYVGIDEFDGYIVFVFSNTKNVVLECPVYGNAIYIIRENWQSLSRLSKSELLSRFPSQAVRVVHAGDWYPRVQEELFSRVG